MTQMVWIGALDDSPLGAIWVAVGERGLLAVNLWGTQAAIGAQVAALVGVEPVLAPEHVATVIQQLATYFDKSRKVFDLSLDWSVLTPFQAEALRAVCGVGYGRTATYADIAHQLDKPGAVRAVGRANATNPMPIVIPCHRILGSDGKLHGYSAPGGLETKAWLLRHEGSWLI